MEQSFKMEEGFFTPALVIVITFLALIVVMFGKIYFLYRIFILCKYDFDQNRSTSVKKERQQKE